MVPLPETFDYHLPENLIAATHAIPRDHSRLMLVDRQLQTIDPNHHFYDIKQFLRPSDVLVLNQTKVFPARLYGQKSTGGKVEILLLEQQNLDTWVCISKPGLKLEQQIDFPHDLKAICKQRNIATGEAVIQFNVSGNPLLNLIDLIGTTPLPHYIANPQSESELRQIYQTVYAKDKGSAAAPTAGLHFTPQLLDEVAALGVQIEKITLHVGLGTFQPLRPENLSTATLHTEKYYFDAQTSQRLQQYKKEQRRIISVGTTSARALESNPQLKSGWQQTNIFIYPPYKFQVVDALITNFHLPTSSLLMMVTAFASSPNCSIPYTDFSSSLIQKAYQVAIDSQFHFYSFGDAMLIC